MGDSNLLFESVFKRKLSAADTREYLKQITAEYPFFTPAQFYLMLVSRDVTTDYEKQVAKTSILFNNPWWLQFQLLEKQQISTEPGETIDTTGLQIEAEAVPVEINVLQTIQPTETTDVNNSVNQTLQPEIASIIPVIELTQPEEGNVILQTENIISTTIEEDTTAPIISENPGFESENIAGLTSSTIEMVTVFKENPVFYEAKEEIENLSTPGEIPVLSVEERVDEKINNLQTGHFNNDPEPLVNEAESEEEITNDKEIAPLNFKLNIDTSNTTEDSIAFEPLHTTDYFASLGIKLSSEIPPSDKLGNQLKSFTEWLKTMKKIHQDHPQAQSGVADIAIQNLAEKSNREDEVVTEAMAEVLLQQGKTNKAIEVLKKLSLLNPSKSAYFAAKIDQLKEN